MKNDKIILSMGAGGRLSAELMEEVFLPIYGNDILNNLDDSAEVRLSSPRIAFTTDSYTVKPIFFPGGNIGKLSICGTVNDLSVKGAKPVAISAGFIIEEGFSINDLKIIARSMHETALVAGVNVVTGDTKVVARSEADGVFINTSGIGVIPDTMNISCRTAKVGDDILISGSVADHGIAIMNARQNLGFIPPIQSDVACLSGMAQSLGELGKYIRVMRDPTRGGLASLLNEIAKASRVTIRICEEAIPVKKEVRMCCEILGLDPLYVANEGKLAIFCDPSATSRVIAKLRQDPLGKEAQVIGRVDEAPYSDGVPPVFLQTSIGTKRFVPLIDGELLPRIC